MLFFLLMLQGWGVFSSECVLVLLVMLMLMLIEFQEHAS